MLAAVPDRGCTVSGFFPRTVLCPEGRSFRSRGAEVFILEVCFGFVALILRAWPQISYLLQK